MEKKVRVFHSFEEADKADREFYASLTPQQRLDIMLELIYQADPDAAKQRLARVSRVVELKRS